ncbi:MAG TPA: hypothetical protein VD902_18220, partial [Symbiobacteriaceae bacterium]|nr:hypothetical protein [Symbiobacteriaceae bacterium]
WPLLAGERAHYELAAGREISPFIRSLERFATVTGMLPEQVWDEADRPALGLYLGRPTGAAMPLMWAHAEYIKLLRSAYDRQVFDRIEPVYDRYVLNRRPAEPLEIWKRNRRPQAVARGTRLRVQAGAPFRLRWSADNWATVHDTAATATGVEMYFVDLPADLEQVAPYRFTFYWTREDRWEGEDFAVALLATWVKNPIPLA